MTQKVKIILQYGVQYPKKLQYKGVLLQYMALYCNSSSPVYVYDMYYMM